MSEHDLMIRINNVSKQYKLGQIGGTTLRDELQRKRAKLFKKDDPTKRIGSRDYVKGETFMALDGVSFDVKKGERVGIIGHNGAGKSTLLKLLSRVTAPTNGKIGLNGRIASMLEVGTGFHGELTGRENIYMNGAILGMTKKEIDAKIEDIIEFSECRQFIDTPVKRYSSGMYVKLAFSVAAHLDSEIMIMDEVLAVGDMAFQKKCLNKMKNISRNEGRTILYVSHNMSTIRQLCDRCVVLKHGHLIFDGNVEEAIQIYSQASVELGSFVDLSKRERDMGNIQQWKVFLESIETVDKDDIFFDSNEKMRLKITWTAKEDVENVKFRFVFTYKDSTKIGLAMKDDGVSAKKNERHEMIVEFDISYFVSGMYYVSLIASNINAIGQIINLDSFKEPVFGFEVSNKDVHMYWHRDVWGHLNIPIQQIFI